MTISFTLLVRMGAAFQVVAFQEMSQKQSSGNQLETQTQCFLFTHWCILPPVLCFSGLRNAKGIIIHIIQQQSHVRGFSGQCPNDEATRCICEMAWRCRPKPQYWHLRLSCRWPKCQMHGMTMTDMANRKFWKVVHGLFMWFIDFVVSTWVYMCLWALWV